MSGLIYDSRHYATISKGIIEQKKAEFAYRVRPKGIDSGWRVFADRNDASDEFFIVSLYELREWFSDTMQYYEEKPFTVAEKTRNGWVARSRKDKELKAVPKKLREARNKHEGIKEYDGEAPAKRGLFDNIYNAKGNIACGGFFATNLKLVLVPYEDD